MIRVESGYLNYYLGGFSSRDAVTAQGHLNGRQDLI